MKNFLLLLMSAFVLMSCGDEIPQIERKHHQGRSVFAYLVSNNSGPSLSDDLKKNIVGMYNGMVSCTDTCKLLVFYRPYDSESDFHGPTILEFISDSHGKVNGKQALTGAEATLSNIIAQAIKYRVRGTDGNSANLNSTDPAVMESVLRKMKSLAPSDSYGLVVGSHGNNWLEGNSVQSKSFGDDAGNSISIPHLANVLQKVFETDELDYLLFDACLMGSIEVCYELRNVLKYCIASPQEIPAAGFPYDDIMQNLYDKDIDYQEICDSYIAHCKKEDSWGTVAAYDMAEIEDVQVWFKNEIQNKDLDFSPYIYSIQQYGRSSFKNLIFDVVDAVKVMNGGEVDDDLEKAMDKFVIAKACIPDFTKYGGGLYIEESRYSGLGMYIPNASNKDSWNSYYKTLSWSQAVGWDK